MNPQIPYRHLVVPQRYGESFLFDYEGSRYLASFCVMGVRDENCSIPLLDLLHIFLVPQPIDGPLSEADPVMISLEEEFSIGIKDLVSEQPLEDGTPAMFQLGPALPAFLCEHMIEVLKVLQEGPYQLHLPLVARFNRAYEMAVIAKHIKGMTPSVR